MRILVVEDGPQAIALTDVAPFDAMVLDVMLPGPDGFEVCSPVSRAMKVRGQVVRVDVVESETAQALAEYVEISFDAEAESDTVGINKIRVVLPEGIAPADVAYGEGPKGWKFTSGEDGYTVEGAALKPGTNAEYSIGVKQLPDAKVLAFKNASELQRRPDRPLDRAGRGQREPRARPEAEGGGSRRQARQPVPR